MHVSECELTVRCEIEETRHRLGTTIGVARIREAGSGMAELIKERVTHSVNGGQTLSGGVLEESGDEINGISRGLTEHLTRQISYGARTT